MLGGQVVDTESAKDFMKEALNKISPGELDQVADEMAEKSRLFQARLGDASLHPLDDESLRPVLRGIFCVRRKTDELLDKAGGRTGGWIQDLLWGADSPERRLEAFCENLSRILPPALQHDFASEILHYVAPEKFWLWTRWMWDPKTKTGALPLVTVDGVELEAEGIGAGYMRVGEAVSFVRLVGEAAGFSRIGRGPHGVYVYLACVYAVYMYTTLRLRMTQEFNNVVPQLPELTRRILGTYRLKV
jgi:hypothetical protein